MITGEVFPGEDAEILVEAIKNDYSGEDIDGITNPVVYVKHYKQDPVQAVGATATYISTMGQYNVVIPAAYVPASGTFDGVLKGDDIADVLFRLQVNTGDAQLTAIKAITDLLTADPLAAINAEVDKAISDAAIVSKIDTVDTVVDGIAIALETPDNFKADVSRLATSAEVAALSNIAAVGAEKIVPADKYAFDASAKTLTFSSPYNTLTVEQVTFIKNLTTNYIIWDCRYAGYQTLPIRFGATPNTHVLSFDSADLDAANTDKIMIVVNQV